MVGELRFCKSRGVAKNFKKKKRKKMRSYWRRGGLLKPYDWWSYKKLAIKKKEWNNGICGNVGHGPMRRSSYEVKSQRER